MIICHVPMKINAEKKHSVRYDAIMPDAEVTSVYIMKKAFKAKVPESVTVVIEMENE